MDSIAAGIAHYFLVCLRSIEAESVIDYIAKHYRNPNLLNQCIQSNQDFISSCGEFTMIGYIIIFFFITSIIGRGFFFFSSSSN